MGKSNKFSLTTKSHSSTRVNPYDKITLNALNVICPDQKIVLPKLESNGIQLIIIELYSLFIFVIALGTQYLNLYRSVWWLSQQAQQQQQHHYHQQQQHPHQAALQQPLNHNSNNHQPLAAAGAHHTRSAPGATATNSNSLISSQFAATVSSINYHLIDLDVSQFSIIFIGQSSLICILRALLNRAALAAAASSATTTTASASSSTATSTSNGSSSTSKQARRLFSQLTPTKSPPNNNMITQGSSSLETNHTKQPQTSSQTTPTSSSSSSPIDGNTLATIVIALASWICNYYLFKCAYRIWNNFGLNGVSCISYPIVFSVIMNSTHIIQVVESCRKTGKLNLSFLTLSMTLFSSHINYDDDKLCHNCSNQPDEIRDEVEKLRTIFNERLKFVLFKSILLAYYSSFVPICFAQSFLYYDFTWTTQHVVITWFSSLIMLLSSSYTPHFYDVLHRSAYHFGKWQKLEARNTLVPCINWSENVIYPQGVVVKHYRGYFRSESVSNCAQPGVSSHLRYYIVFSNPKIGFMVAFGMLALLLLAQMYLFFISTEWYKLMAMFNMMLVNVLSIYRLVKSLVVITKIYKEKQ